MPYKGLYIQDIQGIHKTQQNVNNPIKNGEDR